MAGSKETGRKAAATNKKKYGDDFYKKIGKQSALAYLEQKAEGTAKPRGFAVNRELAVSAGRIGGSKKKS